MSSGRTGSSIGRVGALAIALGIGGAIVGLPAVAVADTGPAGDASVASPADSPATRPSRGTHRKASTASAETPEAPSSDGRGGRRSTFPGAAAAKRFNHGQPSATSIPAPQVIVAAVDVARGPSFPVAQTDSAPATPAAIQLNTPIPAAASVTVPPVVLSPPAAPVMASAMPRGALSAAGSRLLAWLRGGTDPLAPIATPIAWAAVAASRRELSATVVPAASVTLAQPAAAVAAGPLSQPAVVTALVGAAKQVILAVAGGADIGPVLKNALASLDADPAFADITLDSVLTDPALPQSMGATTAALVTGLAADNTVRAAVGQQLSESIAASLGHGTLGDKIGASVGAAVVSLLADPAAAHGLGAVASTFVSVALSQPGVSATAVDVARELYSGVMGSDPSAALDAAWAALQLDSAFRSGVGPAVAAAVNVGLTNAGLVQALGTTTTSLVSQLAGEPGFATAVAALVGPAYSGVVLGMLADHVATQRLAVLAGSLVTGFAGAPGVAAALSAAAGQIATAALGGADLSGVLLGTLNSLESNAAITAAIDAAVSTAVQTILGDAGVGGTVNQLARSLVVSFVESAVPASPLGEAAVKVASAAVDSLLTNSAVQNLISTLAGDVVSGTPVNDLAQNAIASVINDRALQVAVGMAVGDAVGALFGDNAIGAIVGKVVGSAATVVIGVVAKFAHLFGLFKPAANGAAAVGTSNSGLVYLLTV